MRILIDGGCWTNRRGYGRFTRELVHALSRVPRHEFVVLLDERAREEYDAPLPAIYAKLSQSVDRAATSSGRRSVRDLLAMSSAAARARPEAVFFPSVYSYFPVLPPRRALLGIHDTMADRIPEFAFDSPAQQRLWRWKMRLALSQCRDVLTVSQYSKESIASHWRLPSERIHVIPEGPAALFHPRDVPKRDFVLCVGGLSPNKNLATLIRAFSNVRPGYELWIVGDYESDGFKSCYADLAALAQGKPVRFTGRLTDEELCRAYNEARLLAFPSLDEGFGLPAVEAMACGLPVVAHHGHALAEVVGDAGLLIDTREPDQLAAAINRVLDDAAMSAQLRTKGLERSARFSWDRAAAELQDIFRCIWQ